MKILLTGADGKVGTVLQNQLSQDLNITDLPTNLSNFEVCLDAVSGHDIVIHLAWDGHIDYDFSEDFDVKNIEMYKNIYEASLLSGVRRVIMASSVHADDFVDYKGKIPMSPSDLPTPQNPYGASKCFMEALGRYYAKKGLEVICIRLGGVTMDNKPETKPDYEKAVWLSHEDCGKVFEKSINGKLEDNYAILYAISNNPSLKHDISMPF